MELTIKIPVGLVTELAQQRGKVTRYETHRGFKALAFYLLSRSLTTSSGVYRKLNNGRLDKGAADGFETWSKFHKGIAKKIGGTFNTVKNSASFAEDFGFMQKTTKGYSFVSLDTIIENYGLFGNANKFHTLTISPNESLEHILKTLVIKENFDKQEHCVTQKIKRIPDLKAKLSKYIPNWQTLPAKQLLSQVVQWQKHTFLNFSKGTEAYDLFHSIHADIALTCNKISQHFAFKSRQSSLYFKKVLSELQYITVLKRELVGYTTRKPHEFDGSVKPVHMVWMPGQMQRKWVLPDLITLNLKNLQK